MRKFLCLILACLLSLPANSGTITGTIQTATGGVVANGTLTFTLSQPGVLGGGTGGTGSGSVTSVGFVGPTGFQVSGSPVTISGNLTLSMPSSWATGDLLLGNGANSVARLGIGANGTFLGSNGTTASWQTVSGSSSAFDAITSGTNITAAMHVGTGASLDATGSGTLTATSAAKWTTARLLAGNSVDGSANVTFANKFIVQGTSDTGLSNAQFLGALATGILKNTTSTGVLSAAASSDVVSLFSGCSGTQALGADGSCHTSTGVPGGSPTQLQYNNTTFGGISQWTTNGTTDLTAGATGIFDLSSAANNALRVATRPNVDVTSYPFNAKGDTQVNGFGSFTANSTTITIGGPGTAARFNASRDVGKAISITTNPLALQPALPGSAVASGGSCTGTGALGSATADAYVYYILTYWDPTNSVESPASYEGFNLISAGTGSGTNACVKITTPIAVPASYPTTYTQYRVRAVAETNPAYPGIASGTEYAANKLQATVNVGTDYEIDSILTNSAAAVSRTLPQFIGTIASVTDTTHAVVNANISTKTTSCPASPTPCAFVSWGTDDTAAIAAAIAYVQGLGKRGGTLFFPGPTSNVAGATGMYLTTGISVPGGETTNSYYRFTGGGGFGGFTLTYTNFQNPMASAQLVSFSDGPILTIGDSTGAVSTNTGSTIDNMGFQDVSGACRVKGGINMFGVSRAKVQNVSGGDFCRADTEQLVSSGQTVPNGYFVRFDAACQTGTVGCTAPVPFNNFEFVDTLICTNCQYVIQAVNGKQSEFRFNNLEAESPGYGGGVGVLYDGGVVSGATTSGGGQNTLTNSTFAYYPLGMYANSIGGAKYDFVHDESTLDNTFNASGSSHFGTGLAIVGLTGQTFCQGNDIFAKTDAQMGLGVYIGPDCSATTVIGSSKNSATLSLMKDEGSATVSVLNGNGLLGGLFGVANTNLGVKKGTTFTDGSLGCWVSGSNRTVATCSSGANNANWAGIIVNQDAALGTSPSSGGYLQLTGIATVNFNSATSAAVGDNICVDGTNAGKVINNSSTICNGGTQVGKAITAETTQTSVQVQLSNNGFTATGGTGTVTSSGTPTIHQIPLWTTSTDLKGISCAVNTLLHGATAADPACSAVVEADMSTSDVTTLNVSSTKHGFAPKSPADATQFLNGATTAAFAAVKDSDLSTTDITTNNVSSSKHGFSPKSPADATQFLNGATTPAFAAVKDSDLTTTDVIANNVSTSKHGFAPKAPNDATKFLDGTGAYSVPGSPLTTLGDMTYGGAAGIPTRLAGPTATNSVPQFFTETPSGGLAVAPVWAPAGVGTRASTCGSNVDTILATDRASYVSWSDASTCVVTLPQAGSTGFASNFVMVGCDIGAGQSTITPTTSTISYTTGSAYTSAASTMPLTTGQCAWIYSDNTNYFAIVRGAGGSGTVTVVGAGSLTSTALVTGGGTTTLQTPSATSTLDASGNLAVAAGGSVGSADTGTPKITFASNLGTFNKGFTVQGVIGCGLAATTTCIITGGGSTSGTATLTWPNTAGTTTNAIVSSNNLSAPALVSSVSTGTAPLQVASTTNVANLNASSLAGATFSAPGAIGGGTPSSGAFTTITGTSSATLGTNGGTGGSVVINGSTSGSSTINASATGVLALPSGTTATSMALTTPLLGTPTSGVLTNATGLPESSLVGASAATTITEGSATAAITRAGVATANLTAPQVFLNTNSTNNNTSIGLGISTPGTSTGQTTLNINGAATGGDLTDWGTGGSWSAGVLSSQTILAKVGITGGFTGLNFTSNGTTAGFVDFPQGTTSAAVAPCNTATSICEQAPTAVTSYLVNKPGVAAGGTLIGTNTSAVITQGFSGDTNHSATVTTGSGTSIGSTSLCSTTFCPVGTYRVNVYIDITTACGTSGTYVVNLIYTDDQGSKTVPVNLEGTGSVPATGVLTTISTANFGYDAFILRSTGGASINYSTTAVACGTAGPMVGKLYLSVEPIM